MLNALEELKAEGMVFDIAFSRLPFFLRPSEEVVAGFLAKAGCPRDATRGEAFPKLFGPHVIPHMNDLFKSAGLDAFWGSQFSETMDSHRLAWHAAAQSDEMGERFWRATSRRFFEGKDTSVQPIRLDSRDMLLECAAEVGMDREDALRVLDSDLHRNDILRCVERMHAAGINSIPVLIFEVEGVADGSWMANPDGRGREINHGSGSKEDFKTVLTRLHATAGGRAAL